MDGESYSVGSYGISMALDQTGNQHVSYYNASASSLMYAWYDVRLASRGGRQHGFLRVLLVDSDRPLRQPPHILRQHHPNPDAVMYAHHNGTAWTTEVIDATPYYAFDTSIDLDSSGNPHISYAVYNSTGSSYNLRYSYHNGSEWV